MRTNFLKRVSQAICVIAAVSIGLPVFAQVGTGSVAGTVRLDDGTPAAGVSVTALSPALQGSRTVITESNGDYLVRGLPPGEYRIQYQLGGMQTVERPVTVNLGGTARLDVQIRPAATSESIVVTAEAPTLIERSELGDNYQSEEINTLPIARGLNTIAALTPGVTTGASTANAGQVKIAGGFGFDNVFLVDGTDINDNLFGTANNLFIEDAIAETQVLVGGISAEFGRFSGGVVNAITKSGGNEFDGTVRADLTNPEWTDETPFEKSRGIERPDQQSEIFTATLGGPIVRDHLWFFLAGRYTEATVVNSLPETGIQLTEPQENPRWEAKLTATPLEGHTFQGSYLDNETTQGPNRPTFSFTIDPRATVSRTLPNERFALNYTGVLTSSLYAEVAYSEKKFGFRNSGGTSRDILDSPFLTRTGPTRHYNAPYFDSTDPEDRNNQDLSASLSYFFAPGVAGSHDIKAGYEQYISNRTGGNSQSATDYVFVTNFKRNADGTPAVDSAGRIIPVFVPNPQTGFTQVQQWLPVRGANVDLETQSFYVNDRWNLNEHWSFNLGARYEQVTGEATGGIETVNTDRLSPRLAASYDPLGNGRFRFDLTYGEYSGKYSETQFARNTNVGTPNLLLYSYTGPAGEGINFAPGFDINNYTIIGGSFPTQNVFFADDTKSAVAEEWTLSAGAALSRNANFKVTYMTREWSSFLENFTTVETGTTEIVYNGRSFGVFDNVVNANTDDLTREYEAIFFQGRWLPLNWWTMDLNWTHELRNHGNAEGEAVNQPGVSSIFGDYPEIYALERSLPSGRLSGFQEDRVRLFNTFNIPVGAFGRFDLGLIYSYDSPLTYSYSVGGVPITAIQKARTPAAYKRPPTSQTIFFGDRGEGEFESVSTFDVSLMYSLPILRAVEPWIKLTAFNATNEDSLVTFDTTISADANSEKDEHGLPTGYIRGARFGQATSANNYQTPRTYAVSAGIRF